MNINCFIYSIFMQLQLPEASSTIYMNTEYVRCKNAVFAGENIVCDSCIRNEETLKIK